MNPFYFGMGANRLFGVYTPARGPGPSKRAMVFCNPWGQEYLRAHRSMKQLAHLMANDGVHVLRFDYLGTGDSAGEMTDGGIALWQKDIEAAIDELRDTTGLARVGLLGLRLGAALAAITAEKRRKDIDVLVMWDPVVSGAEYVAELKQADGPGKMRPAHAGGGVEVMGFPLTAMMAAEIAAIDLGSTLTWFPQRTLVVASESLRVREVLLERLAELTNSHGTIERVPTKPAWLEDRSTGAGAIPVPLLHRIVQWAGR